MSNHNFDHDIRAMTPNQPTAEIHAAVGRSREVWPVSTIEQWCPVARKWLNPSCGDIVGIHYRTKKPFGYFLTH